MEQVLPIIIYFLLIVLIIVAIIVGIKLMFTLNKVDALVEDVNKKVSSLDRVFEIIDFATDRMSMISEVVISFLTTGYKKLFGKKRTKKTKKEENLDE